MAYGKIVKEQALQFYVVEGKSINQISKLMKIPEKTLYKWKLKYEWDAKIKSTSGIHIGIQIMSEFEKAVKKAMAEGKLTDPPTADALHKTMIMVEKFTPKKMMLSNIFNMLDDITNYIKARVGDDKFLDSWAKYLPEIADYLRGKYNE